VTADRKQTHLNNQAYDLAALHARLQGPEAPNAAVNCSPSEFYRMFTEEVARVVAAEPGQNTCRSRRGCTEPAFWHGFCAPHWYELDN